ncbi:hypothetical protein PMAYCL1PPCAC_04382, partial [Pristionchus mayeri]
AVPLERRGNLEGDVTIHSCVLPSTGDGRMFGLLFVFIILPSSPHHHLHLGNLLRHDRNR